MKNLDEPGQIERALEKGEAKLRSFLHPDPYIGAQSSVKYPVWLASCLGMMLGPADWPGWLCSVLCPGPNIAGLPTFLHTCASGWQAGLQSCCALLRCRYHSHLAGNPMSCLALTPAHSFVRTPTCSALPARRQHVCSQPALPEGGESPGCQGWRRMANPPHGPACSGQGSMFATPFTLRGMWLPGTAALLCAARWGGARACLWYSCRLPRRCPNPSCLGPSTDSTPAWSNIFSMTMCTLWAAGQDVHQLWPGGPPLSVLQLWPGGPPLSGLRPARRWMLGARRGGPLGARACDGSRTCHAARLWVAGTRVARAHLGSASGIAQVAAIAMKHPGGSPSRAADGSPAPAGVAGWHARRTCLSLSSAFGWPRLLRA